VVVYVGNGTHGARGMELEGALVLRHVATAKSINTQRW
jgi:hypothetical protein